MGIEYVMVDSSQQRNHLGEKGQSKIKVDLNHAIVNPISVKVASFSVPNEMYNVKSGQNTFSMMLYTLSTNSYETKTYEIAPGLYKISELVDACNLQMTGSPFSVLTPQFALLASNKVSLTASSTGVQVRRLMLYGPIRKFNNSIFHRLGFNRNQVLLSNNSLARANYNNTPGVDNLWSYVSSVGYIDGIDETVWRADTSNAIYWKTEGVGETHTGMNIGFESYQHLYLKSDLVNGDFQSIHMDDKGLTMTTNEQILQKIDINVSHYNYLHLENTTNVMQHKLSAKTINSFTIELTDDQGLIFDTHESKAFNVILQFETADTNNNINEINALENQKLLFKALHNCGFK